MYVKLFASLYQGTLRGRADEILVFTNLLAHADQHGVVDKHWKAIADETGLDKDRVMNAISNLEAPDEESRSPEMGGCRIVRLDEHRAWGWQVVNYGKYRSIRNEDDRREQNRIAQEKWRNKQRKTRSAQEEAEAEAEASTSKTNTVHSRFVKPELADVEMYCRERGNSVDPSSFVDFYESNGWKVGRNQMKDWKAAVRTWEKNNRGTNGKDTRSRAKRVADNLNDIARRDIKRNGFTEKLD